MYFPCDHHMKAENWRTRSPWSLTPFADWLIDSSRCSQVSTCPPLPDRAGNCYSVKSELSWRKRRGSKWLSGLRLPPRGIQPRGTGGIHSSLKSHGGYCSYFVKYIVQLKKKIYWSFSQNHTIIITLYSILISEQLLIYEALKKKKKNIERSTCENHTFNGISKHTEKNSRFIINRQSNAYVRNKPTELKNTFDELVIWNMINRTQCKRYCIKSGVS